MNRASFTKWSGMAGMAGSALLLLGLIGASVFSDSEYPYTYDGMDVAASLFYLTGVVLTLVFAVGFALTYGRRVGGLGQAGLLLAFLGLVSQGLGAIGFLAGAIRGAEIDGSWNFFIFGLTGTLAGAAIFCLAGSVQKALPSIGSKLAMAGGFSGLALLLLSMGLMPGTDYEAMRVGLITAFAASLVAFTAGLFLLGYALWNGRGAATTRIEPAPLG